MPTYTVIASVTDYWANKLLDLGLSAVPVTPPTGLKLKAYSVAPTKLGGGTEIAGNGYAPLAITPNLTNFPAAANGAKSNGQQFNLPVATGAYEIVAIAITDQNDNMLYYALLTDGSGNPAPVTVGVGQFFAVQAAGLTWSTTVTGSTS